MADFKIQFEWEDSPRARAPELDATWARLEINIGSESATKVEANRSQSVRRGIYVPLYPVAEWMIANWWSLWDEWRRDGRESGHCLLAAREGFALPDLRFWPTETTMQVTWQPLDSPSAGVSFLSGGNEVVAKPQVRQEFCRMIQSVLDRLELRKVPGSHLAEEWAAIQSAEQDPEQRAFCERAARLGCDPFAMDDQLAQQLEQVGSLLPAGLLDDFCDSIQAAEITSASQAVEDFLAKARLERPVAGRWPECAAELQKYASSIPWQEGYQQARALRLHLGLQSASLVNLQTLQEQMGSLEIRHLAPFGGIDAVSAPSLTSAPVLGLRDRPREDQTRFNICRALANSLKSEQPSLVTRGRSEYQQRNRAFAAEFLAPAELIRNRIKRTRLGDEDVEELAREFQVSDLVVRHQIQNHRLASLYA